MRVFCMVCNKEENVTLVTGEEIYPHRPDLYSLPFWMCKCGAYVGCHHKSDEPTKPLGIIPSKEMKKVRSAIHTLMDPIWQTKRMRRKDVYSALSKALGRTYHTADLVSMLEAGKVKEEVLRLRESVGLLNI